MPINLTRQSINQLDFKRLNIEVEQLKEILKQSVESNLFQETLFQIVAFQDQEGSFSLLESFGVEAHLRVAYYYQPTYIASAILMKQYLYKESEELKTVLHKALKVCMQRYLKGAGYNDISGQIEAIQYFISADIKEFLTKYPELCFEFTQLIKDIVEFYRECIDEERTIFGMNEDYVTDFKLICEAIGEVNLPKMVNENIEPVNEKTLYTEINEIFEDESLVENLRNRVPKKIKLSASQRYRRSAMVAASALIKANYLCEFNPMHSTFIRRVNKKPYTEPHHLIPLSAQGNFKANLDREENIISLCSHCHNNVHYGEEREKILKRLFEERAMNLKEIGIHITFEELLMYY